MDAHVAGFVSALRPEAFHETQTFLHLLGARPSLVYFVSKI